MLNKLYSAAPVILTGIAFFAFHKYIYPSLNFTPKENVLNISYQENSKKEKELEKTYIVNQEEIQKQTLKLKKNYEIKQQNLQQKISKLESKYSDLEKTLENLEDKTELGKVSTKKPVLNKDIFDYVSNKINASKHKQDSIKNNINNYFKEDKQDKQDKLVKEVIKSEASTNYQKLSLEYNPIKIPE